MSQPPKSTIFAPAARWVAFKIVCLVMRIWPGVKTGIIADTDKKLIICRHGAQRYSNRRCGVAPGRRRGARAALQRRLDAGAFRRTGSEAQRLEAALAGNPGRGLQRCRAH